MTMKQFQQTLVIMLMLSAAGCKQIPTGSTAVPTLVPLTQSSSCSFNCNITAEQYGFDVSCEHGQVTKKVSDATNIEYGTAGQVKALKVNVNQELTYQDTQKTYQVGGVILIDKSTNNLSYEIKATGGAFGNVPQVCKSGENITSDAPPASDALDTGMIKGLFPDNIVKAMEKQGLQCDRAQVNANWYAWKCNLYQESNWIGYVEFFSKSLKASIDQLEATALMPADPAAVEVLTLAAMLPYANAEPEKAQMWVKQSLPALQEGSQVEEVFGGVKYVLKKAPGAGWLTLLFEARP